MKKYFSILIVLAVGINIYAQDISRGRLDSLFNTFVSMRSKNIKNKSLSVTSLDTTHVKCGFGIVSQIRTNLRYFTESQRAILKPLMDRPSSDTSFVTPGGFFRVHFTKADTPDYIPDNIRDTITTPREMSYLKNAYLDSLAIALDSAYNFEVNYLGYPPPPSDNGAGGDDKYDIYIESGLGTEYGETDPEDEVVSGSNRYTSYMQINNSFKGFYTNGINAARVTTAHEFHHSIQAGNYILRYDLDEFFYELTSTAMEHFVYPGIKDYLQYLTYYFHNTQNSMALNGSGVSFPLSLQEYALGIWNIFLKDRYGYDIIKKQWELMPQMRALQAIANSLIDYNTSLGKELNEFGIWTYYTNYRTKPGIYFEDAAYYPVILPAATLHMDGNSVPVNSVSAPVSNNFITFIKKDTLISTADSMSSKIDTLVTIISNSDVDNGINNTTSDYSYNFVLYDSPVSGSTQIADNYYETFNADMLSFWTSSAILNSNVVDTTYYVTKNKDIVFPSPFSYKKNAFLYIPAAPDPYNNTTLNIYNIAMKLVYSAGDNVINYLGHNVIRWNGLDNKNRKLSTGIYIYVTKSNNEIKKGKLVIFNE